MASVAAFAYTGSPNAKRATIAVTPSLRKNLGTYVQLHAPSRNRTENLLIKSQLL